MVQIRVGQEISGIGWSGIVTSIEHEIGSVSINIYDTMVPKKPTASAVIDIEVAPVREFPRVMMVSDNEVKWEKRVVIASNLSGCIAYNIVEDIDEVHDESEFIKWRFAKEIEPKVPETIEVTIEEIASRFGVSSDQIRVKV